MPAREQGLIVGYFESLFLSVRRQVCFLILFEGGMKIILLV